MLKESSIPSHDICLRERGQEKTGRPKSSLWRNHWSKLFLFQCSQHQKFWHRYQNWHRHKCIIFLSIESKNRARLRNPQPPKIIKRPLNHHLMWVPDDKLRGRETGLVVYLQLHTIWSRNPEHWWKHSGMPAAKEARVRERETRHVTTKFLWLPLWEPRQWPP